MPNHTTTELELMGNNEEIKRFILNVDKGKGNRLNFNSLVPIPAELETTLSPHRILTQEQIDAKKSNYYSLTEDVRKVQESYDPKGEHSFGITQETSDRLNEQYGANNWYDWKQKNWGTKWGAYDTGEWDISEEYATITYLTAWCPATEFFINASKQFPLIKFKHSFADEGGSFLGIEVIQNGEVLDTINYVWDSEDGKSLREELGLDVETEE